MPLPPPQWKNKHDDKSPDENGAGGGKAGGKALQPIIIKRIKKGGGHHGGAWKVAYADFVTAMMAFFLLLWLLNVTTEEQKKAISNYFDPTHPKVSQAESGAGGVLGGLSVAPKGSMVSNVQPITTPQVSGSALNNRKKSEQDPKISPEKAKESAKKTLEKAKEILRKNEEARMKKAEQALKKAIEENPELKALKDNLLIDMTPEGLRIQVIDQEGRPMFPSGSAQMFKNTETLLHKVGEIIREQPNEISIRGHTDSVPYGARADYTNWELSADRANSSRRVLLEGGFPPKRIHDVVGKSDTEHLVPDDPKAARNRRISVILLKEELTDPDYAKKAAEKAKELPPEDYTDEEDTGETQDTPAFPKIGTFRRTPGAVEFP
ncbi:MAG: flagellar motor protein MotB [Alphaproteobacteria bacterium]|nr:flagellar motor protein MotB [Alphaproteobacteria bacterium]